MDAEIFDTYGLFKRLEDESLSPVLSSFREQAHQRLVDAGFEDVTLAPVTAQRDQSDQRLLLTGSMPWDRRMEVFRMLGELEDEIEGEVACPLPRRSETNPDVCELKW